MKHLWKENDYYKIMKKLYFATGNKQKLERMQTLASSVADDFVIQKVPELIDVEENATTPINNAIQKVEAYNDLDAPVIAGDTGVYFDGIAFDPTHVKREALKQVSFENNSPSQEDIYSAMINFYKELASDNGWELPFYYSDWWAIKYPNGSIDTYETKRHNILTNITHWEKQLYFPMCNLYKSQKTWKYYTDRNSEDNVWELAEQVQLLQNIYNNL